MVVDETSQLWLSVVVDEPSQRWLSVVVDEPLQRWLLMNRRNSGLLLARIWHFSYS